MKLSKLKNYIPFKEWMGGMYECLWGQDSSSVMSSADWTL